MEDQNTAMARRIAQEVALQGGRTFYVGGFVRDRLRGVENKDVDIEVHGVTPAQLEAILSALGECITMGASFGVFGLRHYELDIAMPRSESATGRGHKDFAVFVDPFLGVRKAAQRRDFTINALMEDVLTGEVIDSFGGAADLQSGVIRHVNDASFAEDPLRVLRAAQFAARFEFAIAPETVALCREMDVSTLSRERVMGELSKALLKAKRPSVFFEALRTMDKLSDWFPELEALIGVEQDPVHHPEGDVWTHTMLVLDAAARLRAQANAPAGFMLSALCHDLGKATAFQRVDGRIHAYGHETEGVPLAERFVKRLTDEKKLRAYVVSMVELHMRPNMLVANRAGDKAYMKVFDRSADAADLLLLARADHQGRTVAAPYARTESILAEKYALYRARMDAPGVRGTDLMEAGMSPGPAFREALELAHKLQLSGVAREEALRQVLGMQRRK